MDVGGEDMNREKNIITVLGSAGGVAKALLSILNHSVSEENDPINHLMKNSILHLIDKNQKEGKIYHQLYPNLTDKLVFHEFDLEDLSALKNHLKWTDTRIVLDVSWADTVEMLQCCNELGIYYVNTALENRMIDENEDEFFGFPLIERLRIFEEKKNQFTNTKAIVCSGMNPGVVQWMAIELMNQYPGETPRGCYIVEHDNSFYLKKEAAKKDVIYTTWSPECFLDEAISSYPMLMSHFTPLFLHEDVYSLEFKVSLGDKVFHGCLMPHEEVYTLCRLFNMEGGFLYKVNDHTTKLIRDNLENAENLWRFQMKVLDPAEEPLEGEDLVGVLLVYEDKERFIYNTLKNKDIYDKYQTNATYFQVACGLYAALSTLFLDNLPHGVFYVDELLLRTNAKYGEYLKTYMADFVIGQNDQTDGLLLQRMTRI
jgi:homospermidine synthase